MKKNITVVGIFALATALGLSLFAYQADADEVGSAGSRQRGLGMRGSGHERMLEAKSEVLGVSTDELQQQLDSGKTFPEIVEESGMSFLDFHNKMKEVRLAQLEDHLQELVSDGILTQAEADARLEQAAEHSGPMYMGQGRNSFPGRGMRLHNFNPTTR